MKDHAQKTLTEDGRLHLSHGPIDLLIGADGAGRAAAYDAAAARFETVLAELAPELPTLRRPGGDLPEGEIAKAMFAAVRPHSLTAFVTPMAAVAGGVADTILGVMTAAGPLTRAYVNNGGDIALHLSGEARYAMEIAGRDGQRLGRIEVTAADAVRGLATSGWGGRSFSLGAADTVSVLAHSAAAADVAATLIANAVDLPGHPAITRVPAASLAPDSDLGERLVTTDVGDLTEAECDEALAAGAGLAQAMCGRGLISAAALFLKDRLRMVGPPGLIAEEGKTAHD